MTKKLLEDYPHICARIKLARHTERDVVSMSSYEHPYGQHSQGIQGIVTVDKVSLDEAMAQKAEIDEFYRKLPTSELKNIVALKAFKGLEWEEVADFLTEETKKRCTGRSLQRKYLRLFKK